MDSLPDNCIDLIIADGPYGLNKDTWDKINNIQEFNLKLIEKSSRILKQGGGLYLFGKPDCIDFIDYSKYLVLKSKIVWYCPAGLSQGRISYTNNYDIIAYFIKGKKTHTFNLDSIRVAQLTELTQRIRCENVPSVKNGTYGKTLFNSSGKNPGDVWGDIKQLTYNSKELLSGEGKDLHTIQKPEKLIERLVLASSNENDVVFDPFLGTGTTAIVCEKFKRLWFGCELENDKISIIKKRLSDYKTQTKLF
jgi:DNA modification methylase